MLARIVIMALMVLFLSGCGGPTAGQGVDKTTENGVPYRIIVVEGMHCIVLTSTTYNLYKVDSITCNWSEWTGYKK